MLFRPEKENSSKVKKSRHFPKGLVHDFCEKNPPFPHIFFSAKKARKKHFLIFWIEKNAL